MSLMVYIVTYGEYCSWPLQKVRFLVQRPFKKRNINACSHSSLLIKKEEGMEKKQPTGQEPETSRSIANAFTAELWLPQASINPNMQNSSEKCLFQLYDWVYQGGTSLKILYILLFSSLPLSLYNVYFSTLFFIGITIVCIDHFQWQ